MDTSTTREMFVRIFAAFDGRHVSNLQQSVTDDVEVRLGNAPIITGMKAFVDAVNAFHESVAAIRHDVLAVYRDGDVVTVEFEVFYTRHDGVVVALPCCNVFLLRGDLIAEYRSYVDATPVYAAG